MLILAGFQVRKVSDVVPYIGCVRFYGMTDAASEDNEWVCEREANGVYKAQGVETEFFIQGGAIRFDASYDHHPVVERLKELYGKVKQHDHEEGPYGAFQSERDYWAYREGSAFTKQAFGY